jgi:hypothetical protein
MNSDVWGKSCVALIGAIIVRRDVRGGRRSTQLRYEQGESNAKRSGGGAGDVCLATLQSTATATGTGTTLTECGERLHSTGVRTQIESTEQRQMFCTNSTPE